VRTYVATQNAGKLRELKAIFGASELELEIYPPYVAALEDADSFVGNAVLKARALSRQITNGGMQAAVLADDSGLEVDALDRRPGVHSARYAGVDTGWPQRRASLLSELRDVPEERRGARFICAMALIVPDGELLTAIAGVEGCLLPDERGSGGFGYDPLFFYPPLERTFAELSANEKNAVSHRRRAADALLAMLRERG
jgi:XTP/dITP diphosphohydrolase